MEVASYLAIEYAGSYLHLYQAISKCSCLN